MSNTNGGSVRGAVAKVDEARKQPTEQQLALAAVGKGLSYYAPVIEALLPANISVERFKATIANAIRHTKNLAGCEPASIIGAALRAAQLGLEPNDGNNLCYLIPRGTECTFQMGYGGVLELLKRAIPGSKVIGKPVYPNDDFFVDYMHPDEMRHIPYFSRAGVNGRGGEAHLWYIRIDYPAGDAYIHAIDREEVERRRTFSMQKNGDMWTRSYDAKALISCVHDARRWLPRSPELEAAYASEDKVLLPDQLGQIEYGEDTYEPIDIGGLREIEAPAEEALELATPA